MLRFFLLMLLYSSQLELLVALCIKIYYRGCIKAECGLMCPVCSIPIWSKELLPNFQLANVVMLVQHMKSLIAKGMLYKSPLFHL